ncbi:MAG TPA: Ig-like domain-containing protein [Acidobacteriaceae bacterium]|nr:Ig-like domain-containing protein [Acidobacteriaceae bacterium]
MPSSELFRFRTVRPVQHKQSAFSALVIDTAEPVLNRRAYLHLDAPLPPGAFGWVTRVSDALSAVGDLVSPEGLIALLPTDWQTQIASRDWAEAARSTQADLTAIASEIKNVTADAGNYNIPIIPARLASRVELAIRAVLVWDCLSILADDQSQPIDGRQLQTAADIQKALSFRLVALPHESFGKTPPVLACTPGVTDLSIVHDEWNRYVAGELANVINVLPGETLASSSEHMEKTVQATSTSTTSSTTQTNENSQTSSGALSASSTSDANANIGVNGQVEVSGSYGPTSLKTSLGASAQFSKSTATSNALTNSVETVARAVKTVSQSVAQTQSLRTTVRDRTHQQHKLQNTGTDVTVGQYRWLSEVHRVQLVNYPNRLVVEFELPEPGAWLRWALTNQTQAPWDNPHPGAFAFNPSDPSLDLADGLPSTRKLSPTDITPAIAAGLASRWRIQGITSPPPTVVTIGNSYALQKGTNILSDNSLTVPDGYYASSWTADYATIGGDSDADPSYLRVSVAGIGKLFTIQPNNDAILFDGPATWNTTSNNSHNTSVVNTGTIPVYAYGYNMSSRSSGIALSVTVECHQLAAVDDPNNNGVPYVAWQIQTFNLIAAAYNKLLSQYTQERDARTQNSSGTLTVGPPLLNLKQTVAELKRLAIQSLLGQIFQGYDLLEPLPPATGPLAGQQPFFDPRKTIASNPVIQFFEQVFEWENIVYITYPYFWGGLDRWKTNALSASADPLFDQFLNAGSARLVVPARPGMESLVNFFLYTSCIWAGKNPPGPNDPHYLSIADEIQAIQVGATDGTPIYPSWEVILPTTLLWAGTDPSTLPVNYDATIPPPPRRSASVAIVASTSANPSVSGQPVTVTVTLTPATPGAAVPTGRLNILVDGINTSDSPLTLDASGSATSAPIASIGVGTHTIAVDYLGDTVFGRALTNLSPQNVTQGAVTVALTSSLNPSAHGHAVVFSASVTPTAPATGTPTGQVNFLLDGAHTPDSPATLDASGLAKTASLRSLAIGAHTVTVNYLGDPNFTGNTASLPIQTVS